MQAIDEADESATARQQDAVSSPAHVAGAHDTAPGGTAGGVDVPGARARLLRDRSELTERRAVLRAQFVDIVDASTDVSTDDEHDPEGATIAFERAQVSSLIAQVDRRLDEIAEAVRRVEEGAYGCCERCGEGIAPGRLRVRPQAATCIRCARLTMPPRR